MKNWVVIISLALFGCHHSMVTTTVASDDKTYPYGVMQHYGYEVKRGRFPAGTAIRLWGDTLKIELEAPGLTLNKILEQRWLAGNRVVYLNIATTYHKSLGVDYETPVRILYDFERGELHSLSSASAWMVWPVERGPRRGMTSQEFDALLKGVEERHR